MKLKRSLGIGIGLAVLAFALPALAAHHEEGEMAKGKQKAREKVGDAMERAEDAKGEAMRERRDERKAIMEEAKGAAEPGAPRKGKKPWWKFWGADEAE